MTTSFLSGNKNPRLTNRRPYVKLLCNYIDAVVSSADEHRQNPSGLEKIIRSIICLRTGRIVHITK